LHQERYVAVTGSLTDLMIGVEDTLAQLSSKGITEGGHFKEWKDAEST